MPADDDFSVELRGDEDEPLNAKGNDWVASVVVGLVVGGVLAVADHWLGRDGNNNDTLVEVKTKVEYLGQQVNKLTEQPYVSREEFRTGVETVQDRISGLSERVDRLEGRGSPVREAERRR